MEEVIQIAIDRMAFWPGKQFELYHKGQLKPVERPAFALGHQFGTMKP